MARNRPKDPPKKPEAAPFFLPTVGDISGGFKFDDVENEGEEP